jgi:hypothetical protein
LGEAFTGKAVWPAVVVIVALSVVAAGGASDPRTPFRWFEPDATISTDEHKRLARGEVIVKPLPSKSGQLGVFTITELDASPDVFVEWIRQVAELKRSKAVAATRRFSEPPALRDLDQLQLDQRDLDSIRECRPGRCALKLAAGEIETLQRAAAQGGDGAIQEAFRRLLFDRLMVYRTGGLAAVPLPAFSRSVIQPTEVFATLQANSPYIHRSDQRLASWLERPESGRGDDVESFYYWSKEYYSAGKAVVALTHVGVTRAAKGSAGPEVAVVGKQVFATRYMNGMLTHITLSRDPASSEGYMTYTNRAQLDLLNGVFGGVVRGIINGRLKGDAATVLRTLRDRIESGPPKSQAE